MALLMHIRRRMTTFFGVAALIVSAFFTVSAMGRQAGEQVGPSTVTFHLGWDVISALAFIVFVAGIHIEQLRRARADIKAGVDAVGSLDTKFEEHKDEVEKGFEDARKDVDKRFARLADDYVRRDWWADKIKGIEGSQERIERRIDALMVQK